VDANARKLLGEIHDDDAPIVAETPAGWLIVAKHPGGSDHSVVRETYEEAAAFLASLEAAQEVSDESQDTDQHGIVLPDGDRGGPDGSDIPAGAAAAVDREGRVGADHDLRGVEAVPGEVAGRGSPEADDIALEPVNTEVDRAGGDYVEMTAPDYIAAEIDAAETDAPIEVSSTDAIYAGTAFERDEIARLVKQLAIDIAYRREDLLAGIGISSGELEAERVLLYNSPDINGGRPERLNAIGNQISEFIGRRQKIERFANDARRGLDGKTLDYLKTIDVGAMPWPS
jgi:hypothetical protein